ncbi:MAG: hypothetical protein ABIJ05_03635 [Patescibacteria group bacterium]
MQSDSDSQDIIKELKQAGEELEETLQPKFGESKEDSHSFKNKKQQAIPKVKEKEEVCLPKKISEYQEKIAQEQSALEKTCQEVKELKRKLEARIELLQRLQTKSKEFQDDLALAQKEDSGFLVEIKNQLNFNSPSSHHNPQETKGYPGE